MHFKCVHNVLKCVKETGFRASVTEITKNWNNNNNNNNDDNNNNNKILISQEEYWKISSWLPIQTSSIWGCLLFYVHLWIIRKINWKLMDINLQFLFFFNIQTVIHWFFLQYFIYKRYNLILNSPFSRLLKKISKVVKLSFNLLSPCWNVLPLQVFFVMIGSLFHEPGWQKSERCEKHSVSEKTYLDWTVNMSNSLLIVENMKF